MDLLACPYDKHFPLELYAFKINEYQERKVKFKNKPACELYCARYSMQVKDLQKTPDCEECIKYEIDAGILYCPECRRWYPIMEEIPILLPDEMRKKEEDLKLMREFKNKVPEHIMKEGRPWSLGEEVTKG